ncbi:Uncharacterised protein [Vibrio cholerae]|nr:Uncharacterised protein [Vibrio cholerae]
MRGFVSLASGIHLLFSKCATLITTLITIIFTLRFVSLCDGFEYSRLRLF